MASVPHIPAPSYPPPPMALEAELQRVQQGVKEIIGTFRARMSSTDVDFILHKFDSWCKKCNGFSLFIRLTNVMQFVSSELARNVIIQAALLDFKGGDKKAEKKNVSLFKGTQIFIDAIVVRGLQLFFDTCTISEEHSSRLYSEDLGWILSWRYELIPFMTSKLRSFPSNHEGFRKAHPLCQLACDRIDEQEAIFLTRLKTFKKQRAEAEVKALTRGIVSYCDKQSDLYDQRLVLTEQVLQQLNCEISKVLDSPSAPDLSKLQLSGTHEIRADHFGSSANFLGLWSSDVDCSISILAKGDGSCSEKEDVVSMLKNESDADLSDLREKLLDLEDPFFKKSMLPVHRGSVVESGALLSGLKSLFEGDPESAFEVKECILTSRIPILKLVHKISRIDLDICVGNPLALCNTALIRNYITTTGPAGRAFRYLALAVKYWAKQHDCASAHQGTISSYAWVLLVITFLQARDSRLGSRCSLPNLQSKETPIDSNSSSSSSDSSKNGSIVKDTDYLSELGVLFIEFLEFYGVYSGTTKTHFNMYQHLSMIRSGAVQTKSHSTTKTKKESNSDDESEDGGEEEDEEEGGGSEDNGNHEKDVGGKAQTDNIKVGGSAGGGGPSSSNPSASASSSSKLSSPHPNSSSLYKVKVQPLEKWRFCIEDPFENHDLGLHIQRREGMNHILRSLRRTLVGLMESGEPTLNQLAQSFKGLGIDQESKKAIDLINKEEEDGSYSTIWERLCGEGSAAVQVETCDLPPICKFCLSEGHRARTCEKMVCRNCGGIGHLSRRCPNPKTKRVRSKIYCNFCNQEGHTLMRCPDKREIDANKKKEQDNKARLWRGEKDDKQKQPNLLGSPPPSSSSAFPSLSSRPPPPPNVSNISSDSNSNSNSNKSKTQFCREFDKSGVCSRGSGCKFAHIAGSGVAKK